MILPGMPRMSAGKIAQVPSWPVSTTWNPADKAAPITLSSDSLSATGGSNGSVFYGVRSTVEATSKHYWETRVENAPISGSSLRIGMSKPSRSLSWTSSTYPGQGTDNIVYDADGSIYYNNGTVASGIASLQQLGTIIGVAVDIPNLKIYFAVNGVWQAGGDPETGTGGFSFSSGSWFPMAAFILGRTVKVNFNGPFAYRIPAGFEG